MNEQIIQISKRIGEMRDILDISAEEVAAQVGITTQEYIDYENAVSDIPIGVLYAIAGVFGVDPTVLLTGEDPKMNTYTVTRKGCGINIKRYEGYEFQSLAYNFLDREMEPMIVTLKPGHEPALVSHGGHEINVVLKGKMCVNINGKKIVLDEGDSIYFDAKASHGQSAIDSEAQFLTVINDF